MKNLFALLIVFGLITACNATDDSYLAKVEVTNSSAFDRTIETVEIAWNDLKTDGLNPDSLLVVDEASGLEIPSQMCRNIDGEPEMLIFQVQLAKQSSATYVVKNATPASYKSKVSGDVYADRFNDFAWENDVIAFRMYHEALIPVDGASGGIDIWSKRTNELILDKWFALKDYHKDHGEGCDFYKVGPTLGAGGLGFLYQDELIQHSNYITSKIIAEGPIRFQALISFPAVAIGDKNIALSKTLTFDAGQNLNRFDIHFSESCPKAKLVTGIVLRPGDGQIGGNDEFLSYWQPEHKKYGYTGVGIVINDKTERLEIDNHVALTSDFKQKEFTYFTGACWDRAANAGSPLVSPNTKAQWDVYLGTFAQQLKQPLNVKVIKK